MRVLRTAHADADDIGLPRDLGHRVEHRHRLLRPEVTDQVGDQRDLDRRYAVESVADRLRQRRRFQTLGEETWEPREGEPSLRPTHPHPPARRQYL
jgi:hypothetical protein